MYTHHAVRETISTLKFAGKTKIDAKHLSVCSVLEDEAVSLALHSD